MRDLQAQHLRTKVRGLPTVRRGIPFGRGSLFYLLQPLLYWRGQIQGRDPARRAAGVMDRALFEVVQHKLTQQWTMRSRLRNAGGHLLAGVLVDDAAHRMVATDAAKRGVRCRYYVSRPHLAGESRAATLGSVSRLPAAALEEAVTALHDHQAAVRSG